MNEINKIKTLNPICIFGNEESETICKNFEKPGSKIITLVGNHNYMIVLLQLLMSFLKAVELIM